MEAIREAIVRLSAMLDEMSDVARLQVGQALDLQREDLDVGALVRTVAAEYSGAAGTIPHHFLCSACYIVEPLTVVCCFRCKWLCGAQNCQPNGSPGHVCCRRTLTFDTDWTAPPASTNYR
jgi:signal transduction histidine kinase